MQSAVSAEEQLFFLILKGAEVEIVDNARSEILAKFTSLVWVHSFSALVREAKSLLCATDALIQTI